MKRPEIPDHLINRGLDELKQKLDFRLLEKGHGTFASIHEIQGILKEEIEELSDAVHDNDHKQIKEELLDIAVGAVFGAVCIDAGYMDW